MQRDNVLKFLLGAATAALLAFILYQLPPIHSRLNWRFQIVAAYIGGVIHPADQAPTPQPTPTSTATVSLPSPTQTSTAFLTPTVFTVTPTPTNTPTPLPGIVSLSPPQYEKQEVNDCGPASLTMYLRYWGWEGDQADITAEIKPQENDRNVNVEELVYYVNNFAGWLNIQYRVGMDLDDIRTFLAAGIPVVVEETFHSEDAGWPDDDLWAGHYLLITGYDDSQQLLMTQDTYYGANRTVTYQQLNEDWESFNQVLILIYPPEMEEQVKLLLGSDWDVDTNRQNAIEKNQAATEANPEDAFAWFNLGSNQVYFGQYADAANAYDTARAIGLPQRMYRYQFGPFIAYFQLRRTDDLLALTEYALERTPTSEEALLWNGWGLFLQGNMDGAREQWQKALEEHPGYTDAINALDYVNQ